MAGMAECGVDELNPRQSVRAENDAHFRCKDVANKLWEDVTVACGVTRGRYFQMTGMYSGNR